MSGELGNIRLVILFLGLTTLMLAGGGIWLAHNERPVPDFLIALAGFSGGGLGAMLSKTSAQPETQDVKVVDSASSPVVVEPAE